jgi:hypothetical protein
MMIIDHHDSRVYDIGDMVIINNEVYIHVAPGEFMPVVTKNDLVGAMHKIHPENLENNENEVHTKLKEVFKEPKDFDENLI